VALPVTGKARCRQFELKTKRGLYAGLRGMHRTSRFFV
jgi:hypothetical protein